MSAKTWAFCILFAAGCAEPISVGSEAYELGLEGPWTLPSDTRAMGDQQTTVYDGAPPWQGGAGCSGGMRPGTEVVRDYIIEWFPEVTSIGGYNCRPNTANTSQTSVHGTGRAMDIFIKKSGAGADNELGDPLANHLVENAEYYGVQYIVWDRWQWSAHRDPGDKDRSYGGPHPHDDHLHVELTNEAADLLTDFFVDTTVPPRVARCGSIPPEGAIIDNGDPCLRLFGAPEYWRTVNGEGHEGDLVWTNAYDGETPSNWARWQLPFTQAGAYTLSVFIDPAYAVHKEARYTVRHAGGETEVLVDQSAADGWVSLGSFEFTGDRREQVTVSDNAFGPVAEEQHIVVDALEAVPTQVEPPIIEEAQGSGCGCRAADDQSAWFLCLAFALVLVRRRRHSLRA